MHIYLKVVGLVSLLVSGAGAWGDVIISDGTFNPTDWSMTAHPYGTFGGGGSAGQVADIGNPGFAWMVTNSYGSSFSGSYNASVYESFSYNPAVGGALTALSFSIDSRYDSSLNALGFVVRQGAFTWGIGYVTNDWFWQNFAITPTAGDYFVYPLGDPDGPQPDLPDFSASGAPIYFGFWTGNGSGGGFGGSATGLFDNFTVSFIPAPASATWLGLGMLGVSRRRR